MTLVIHNRWLPPRRFYAINLCGLIFTRSKRNLTPQQLNHERIHTAQMRETLFLGFYLCYGVEWIIQFVRLRSAYQAYRHLHFEREAYAHDQDLNYLRKRTHYAWLKSETRTLFKRNIKRTTLFS